jgi:peptidyl-tRNA hydrolase, PTH1 family
MQSLAPRVIVGLGNPGARYENTRHNVGFMVVDALAREAGVKQWSVTGFARLCHLEADGKSVILAKPLSFMNASGEAVQLLLLQAGAAPRDLILVVDDFHLPFGRMRIRKKGSAGGHNGLESVLSTLKSEAVLRVRLGIGEEQMPEDKSDFVLADFPPARQEELMQMIMTAGNALKCILGEGVSKAMSVYNA